MAVGLADQRADDDIVGLRVAAERQPRDTGAGRDAGQRAAIGADQGAAEGFGQGRLLLLGGLAPVAAGGQARRLLEIDEGKDVLVDDLVDAGGIASLDRTVGL
ncbi:hypothetical protein D3C81_1790670 [compost metagenome]